MQLCTVKSFTLGVVYTFDVSNEVVRDGVVSANCGGARETKGSRVPVSSGRPRLQQTDWQTHDSGPQHHIPRAMHIACALRGKKNVTAIYRHLLSLFRRNKTDDCIIRRREGNAISARSWLV